jgi:PRC-barrel domain
VSRVIALERYVGKPVRDAEGRNLGHLHDVRVREHGGELVVIDYLVGRAGLLERFSLAQLGREVGFIFGLNHPGGYVVPWDAMEFGDDGPRCTRRAAELKRINASSRGAR